MSEQTRAGIWNTLNDLIADHPMWIGADDEPLDYSPARESRIHDFVAEATDALAPLVAGWLAEAEAAALREAADHLERHETHAIETALGGVAYPVAVLRDIAATESEPR